MYISITPCAFTIIKYRDNFTVTLPVHQLTISQFYIVMEQFRPGCGHEFHQPDFGNHWHIAQIASKTATVAIIVQYSMRLFQDDLPHSAAIYEIL
jgi:hypothetical protein